MALDPDAFYAHALAAADDEQRLPLSRMTMWDVAPFDQDGLRVAPLRRPCSRSLRATTRTRRPAARARARTACGPTSAGG
jgi:hypothetical protein